MSTFAIMKNIFFLFIGTLLLLFLTYSCKINGSFQSLYGYQHETMTECPGLILKADTTICSLQNTSNSVYSINAMDLKDCLLTFPKSLIYFWQPHCHSEACISPLYLQKKCDDLNIQLFVIAEYFDCEQMRLNNILDKPIFGIDQDYYGTNLTAQYLKKFWCDLTGSRITVNRNRFILFEYGQPKMAKLRIDEIFSTQD